MPSAEESTARMPPVRRIVRALGARGTAFGDGLAPKIREAMPALIMSTAAAVIAAVVLAAISADAQRVSAIFIGLVAVALGLARNRWFFAVSALIATWWLAVVLVRYLPDILNPDPSVAQAIGAAAVFNTPYRGPQIAAVLSVALPAAIALVAVLLAARARRRRGAARVELRGSPAIAGPVARSFGSTTALWAGGAVLALTLVPNLTTILQSAGQPLAYTWDVSNVVTWSNFIQLGLTPMKDFFYPYGLQWIFNVGSEGPIYMWLVDSVLLALTGWSLWRLTGGRAWRVLGCLLAVVVIGTWPQGMWRYLPALVVAIVYAALGPARHTRLGREHVIFFIACLLAGLLGADLLGYGLFGAVLVLVGAVVASTAERRPRRLVAAIGLDAAPVVAATAVVLLVWAATGSFAGYVRFFGGFGAVSAQSASDEKLYGPLGKMVLGPASYSLWAAVPALLATAGLLWARFRPRDAPDLSGILLAASGVSLGLLLKHLVRFIDDQVLVAPIVALAWCAILVWRRDSVVRAGACAAALAALVVFLDHTGGDSPAAYVRSVVDTPARAVGTAAAALDSGLRARAARESLSPTRYTTWPDFTVAAEYARTVGGSPVPPFAIVGDSQMTYVLLRQKPPYQVDMYDASQIAEQRVMVKALQRQRPPYMIWREDFDQDGVPYDVRTPLVFTYMVANYLPVRSFVNPVVDILRRRPADRPVATDFWRSRLGTMEDLGYIPSFSSAAQSPTCAAGPDCVRYVVVHGRGARPGATIAVDVVGNGRTYRIRMWARRGVDVYPVRLDRLWFSPLLGPHPQFVSATPGYAALAQGLRSGGNLY